MEEEKMRAPDVPRTDILQQGPQTASEEVIRDFRGLDLLSPASPAWAPEGARMGQGKGVSRPAVQPTYVDICIYIYVLYTLFWPGGMRGAIHKAQTTHHGSIATSGSVRCNALSH